MSLRKSPRTINEHTQSPISRRSVVPTGRAVVGGLLITVAAIGTFTAYMGASDDSGRDYVVVARDLPTGHRIEQSDLRLEHGDIAEPVAAGSFGSLDELEGAVTLAPMGSDDLLQKSQVATGPATSPDSTEEFSFALDRERALNGDVRRGESIDVLATYGTGADAYTLVVTQRASVKDISEVGRATIGSGARLVLTLALESPAEMLALAHASQVASITIVRTTGADEQATAPLRYPASPKHQDPTQVTDR